MEYAIGLELRGLPAKVSQYRECDFDAVLKTLDEYHQDILKRSFLWRFKNLAKMQFAPQIIDSLVLRLLKPVDGGVYSFCFGDDKIVTFSTFEFSLITGLKCDGQKVPTPKKLSKSRLHLKYFEEQRTIYRGELWNTLKTCPNMLDKLKLCMVYILESFVKGKQAKNGIELYPLELVDDIEAFNNYPWGNKIYVDTVKIFKKTHSMPKAKKTSRKYDAYGFPFALQIWAYEVIPILGDMWAVKTGTRFPRMLNWRVTETPSSRQLSAILDDPELEVLHALTALTVEEQDYMRGLDQRSSIRDISPPLMRSHSPGVSRGSLRSLTPSDQRSPVRDMSPPLMRSHSPRASRGPLPSPTPPRPVPHIDDLFERLVDVIRNEMHALGDELRGKVGALGMKVDALGGKVDSLGSKVDALRDELRGGHGVSDMIPEHDELDDMIAPMTEQDFYRVPTWVAGDVTEGVPRVEEEVLQAEEEVSEVPEDESTKRLTEMVEKRRRKRTVEVKEQIISKRTRQPSQHVLSPFTAEAKKRTFVDGTDVNLFCEVDPTKQKVFDMWYSQLKSKFR